MKARIRPDGSVELLITRTHPDYERLAAKVRAAQQQHARPAAPPPAADWTELPNSLLLQDE